MRSHLNAFLEGWRKGDAGLILGAVADDFIYDDPIDGRFTKAEFAAYLEDLFGLRDGTPGASTDEDFETITDLTVVEEEDGSETAWGWWKATTGEEGAGLVKVGPDGVHSEKVAYYSRPETP
jgi:hypothetical protein